MQHKDMDFLYALRVVAGNYYRVIDLLVESSTMPAEKPYGADFFISCPGRGMEKVHGVARCRDQPQDIVAFEKRLYLLEKDAVEGEIIRNGCEQGCVRG